MKESFAIQFAKEWIDAWNRHDLDLILSHYAEGFEMSSPVICRIANEPSGKLKGKEAVGDYWRKALEMIPNLHFELVNILTGVESIVIYYKGHQGLAAEVFWFNGAGKIIRAFAHYAVAGLPTL
jgi:hypothetical protein